MQNSYDAKPKYFKPKKCYLLSSRKHDSRCLTRILDLDFFHIRGVFDGMDLPDAGEEGNDGERVAHVAGGAGPVHDAHLRVKP